MIIVIMVELVLNQRVQAGDVPHITRALMVHILRIGKNVHGTFKAPFALLRIDVHQSQVIKPLTNIPMG